MEIAELLSLMPCAAARAGRQVALAKNAAGARLFLFTCLSFCLSVSVCLSVSMSVSVSLSLSLPLGVDDAHFLERIPSAQIPEMRRPLRQRLPALRLGPRLASC